YALRETYDPALVTALAKLASDTSKPVAARLPALGSLAALYREPEIWNGVHWRTGPIGFTEESHETAPSIPKTLDWPDTDVIGRTLAVALSDPDLSAFAVRRLPAHPSREIQDALRNLFRASDDNALRSEVLTRLAADGAAADLVREALENGQKNEALVAAAIAAAPANSDDRTADLLLRFAAATPKPDLRAKAIVSIGKLHRADTASLVSGFGKDENAQVRTAVVAALAEAGKPDVIPALTSFLDDHDAEIKRKAIAALGEMKAAPALDKLVEAARQPDTRLEAIAALARIPDVRAIDAYLAGLGEKSPALRDNCAKAITALKPQAAALITERLQLAKAPPTTAEALRKIFGNDFIAQSSDVSPERYDNFAEAHNGDSQKGKEIFKDPQGIGCFRCHTVQGSGGDMGPDLTHIGANYPKAELIESVLYPSKKINGDYQQFSLELKNGESYFGSVRNETAESLVIVDAEGKKHPVQKADIVKRVKSDLSPMPAGLQAGLSLQDFADLIAFLQSLK
ncbi:MAG TPA: HEAT repeat domain-containing protein, partial [Chthoniobacteraceae bacterium]